MRLLIMVADHALITPYPSKSSNHGYVLPTRQIPIVVIKKAAQQLCGFEKSFATHLSGVTGVR